MKKKFVQLQIKSYTEKKLQTHQVEEENNLTLYQFPELSISLEKKYSMKPSLISQMLLQEIQNNKDRINSIESSVEILNISSSPEDFIIKYKFSNYHNLAYIMNKLKAKHSFPQKLVISSKIAQAIFQFHEKKCIIRNLTPLHILF